MAKRSFKELMGDSEGLPPADGFGQISGSEDVSDLVQPSAPEEVLDVPAVLSAEDVRAKALDVLPPGSADMFAVLKGLGIELPEPTLPAGASDAELIAADVAMLNLVLGKVLVNLQFQSSLSETLAKVDDVMGERLNEQLVRQRQSAEDKRYQGAMAAIVGGNPNGGFRFSAPAAYAVPEGWERFAIEAKVEQQALPGGTV